jgi:AcrR family transcriptional regulator
MPRVVASEEQWIEIGLQCFAQGGAEALVIEKMAASLGCSKSSFYWYFKNRDTFLKRIVDKWRERTTDQVIDSSSEESSVDEQILSLLRQMFADKNRGEFLFYLRKLSLKEPAYCSVLNEVEQLRIEYAKGLFLRKGFPEERATRISWMLYHYYLGWYERHKHESVSEQEVEHHIQMLWSEWMNS